MVPQDSGERNLDPAAAVAAAAVAAVAAVAAAVAGTVAGTTAVELMMRQNRARQRIVTIQILNHLTL